MGEFSDLCKDLSYVYLEAVVSSPNELIPLLDSENLRLQQSSFDGTFVKQQLVNISPLCLNTKDLTKTYCWGVVTTDFSAHVNLSHY